MMIYKTACKILDRKVTIAKAPNGRLVHVSMDKISETLNTAALYGLDPVTSNEEDSPGRDLLVPQVSSRLI
jgi:hypothetical protein